MTHPKDIQQAGDWLREANRVVFFTGAGISAESGIATFRDAGGIWERFPPEQFATWDRLLDVAMTSPATFAEFVTELLRPIAAAEPNAGHSAIAEFERHRKTTVVTQNVDALHQAAGSQEVHEIHGTFFSIVNESGEPVRTLTRSDLRSLVERLENQELERVTHAGLEELLKPMMGWEPAGFYRPDLVLFGDGMKEPDWKHALNASRECDVFVTVGTSGLVLPAAMLPIEAAAHGAKTICIDLEPGDADCCLTGKSSEILPQIVAATMDD